MSTPPAPATSAVPRRLVLRDGWRLAVGTLTAIPVRPPERVDSRVAGAAMLLAPVAVLPLAAVWLVLGLLAAVVTPNLGSISLVLAVVAVAVLVLLTRAMHVDGLADLADGLSASYDRERALAVMKTGDVGPSGAAAIVLTLVLQIAATATLFSLATIQPWLLCLGVTALLVSRYVLGVACVRGVPAATPTGLGATVAGSVSRLGLAAGALVLLAVSGAALVVLGTPSIAALGLPVPGVLSLLPLVAILGTGILTAAVLVHRATTRLGGITGDVLGAIVEITFATTLAVAAIVAALIPPPL